MRRVLLLGDEECAALHALSVDRSSQRFRAGDRPMRGTAILRVLLALSKELLALWRGGVLDKRLVRIGAALVHDHSDQQLARLLARRSGTERGDREPYRIQGSGISGKVAATLALCRNARRTRILSRSLHPDVARVLAKALLVGGAAQTAFALGPDRPRALAISYDLNEVRLVLGFVAVRADVPILLILHDYGASEWTRSGAPWIRALPYDCVLVHDAHHVAAMDPSPRSLCLFPSVAQRLPPTPEGGLVVGVLVDAFVNPRHTVLMAGDLALRRGVQRVLIRRHPRSAAADWMTDLPAGVAFADPGAGLDAFAGEVHVAVVSATTAMNQLIRSGVPCLFWDGFDLDRPRDYPTQYLPQRLRRTPDAELSGVLGLRLDRLDWDRGPDSVGPVGRLVIGVPELIRRFHLDAAGGQAEDRPTSETGVRPS